MHENIWCRDFLNKTKANGISPLQIAVLKKNTELVKILVSNGANVTQLDPVTQACPLYIALKTKAPTELIDCLLHHNQPEVALVNHPIRRTIDMSPLF